MDAATSQILHFIHPIRKEDVDTDVILKATDGAIKPREVIFTWMKLLNIGH